MTPPEKPSTRPPGFLDCPTPVAPPFSRLPPPETPTDSACLARCCTPENWTSASPDSKPPCSTQPAESPDQISSPAHHRNWSPTSPPDSRLPRSKSWSKNAARQSDCSSTPACAWGGESLRMVHSDRRSAPCAAKNASNCSSHHRNCAPTTLPWPQSHGNCWPPDAPPASMPMSCPDSSAPTSVAAGTKNNCQNRCTASDGNSGTTRLFSANILHGRTKKTTNLSNSPSHVRW